MVASRFPDRGDGQPRWPQVLPSARVIRFGRLGQEYSLKRFAHFQRDGPQTGFEENDSRAVRHNSKGTQPDFVGVSPPSSLFWFSIEGLGFFRIRSVRPRDEGVRHGALLHALRRIEGLKSTRLSEGPYPQRSQRARCSNQCFPKFLFATLLTDCKKIVSAAVCISP